MMDFIMVPLIVGIVCAGIYGLFELFVRKKERLAIIEKIGDKLDPSADVKIGLPRLSANFSFSSLKAGCLLAGVGLGLLVGFIISVSTTNYDLKNWGEREMVSSIYGASVLLFGGIGLIIAFLVEMKITKDKDK
ncbi:hypothetical protein HMPREF1212_03693 [Parabacteroides sp. HGS0025]|uniref:DUF6249 domain-containing protein n=1 Tax=Parabacteroides sp. HGS0025 TaxID=1078087 RepID=UPI000617278B|nr:DUF6249 domain-containing protein [Parabacteroides sp. HGS0025]KKB47845.1 hypothetical protein HMPREF1212_03693 [Parabacteroides sp. HGS0025]